MQLPEIKFLTTFNHKNLVELKDVILINQIFIFNEELYLVFEYFEKNLY